MGMFVERLFLCCVALAAMLPSLAGGQIDASAGDSVQVSAGSLGVGGLARIGDWAGFEIEFQDSAPEQRELIIQIEGKDTDGDSPLYQRTVTSNPGVLQRTWMYFWIPGTHGANEPFIVSVYEALDLDTQTAERSGVSYKRGQLLTRRQIGGGNNLLPPEIATGLVVGRRVGGLADYSRTTSGTSTEERLFLPRGHEVTFFANDLQPSDLPDRATGLLQFETIVWTSANPAELTNSRSDALIEWVRQGGHLVVCLPSTGQIWFDQDRNRLAALLPDITPTKLEQGASTVGALLSHDETIRLPDSLVVQSLDANATAESADAIAVLRDQEGRTVVSRRLVDLGMVTLIGIDVTNRNLSDRGLPAMDAFWHRVLGKRGRIADRNSTNTQLWGGRELRSFDSGIGSNISSSGSAGAALLLGFALFALYWAVGGPLGYAALRHFGLKKHSWLAFVGAIGLFTLIGWGGVSILRPRTASMQQISFLDAVDRGRFQRVRSFASVFIPGYSDAGIRVGEPSDDGFSPFHNSVTHWSEKFSSMDDLTSFPDSRAYPVSSRDPDTMRFPARATEKRFRFDWTGQSRWAMPQAVSPSGGRGEIRLDGNNNPIGILKHNLPGPLNDTVILVVRGQRDIGVQTGQPVVSNYKAYRYTASREWAPGLDLDLADFSAIADRNRNTPTTGYFDDLLSRTSGGDLGSRTRGTTNERLIASAFVSQLRPPMSSDRGTPAAGVRRVTHGLDLGKWMTQPCIIVLGVVEATAESDMLNPIPVKMQRGGDWKDIEWTGKTVVRWVYPLNNLPPRWPIIQDVQQPQPTEPGQG